MAEFSTARFAARLKELRTEAGLSQSQLARKSGLSLHAITKLEQAQRAPAFATVIALAEAIGVSVAAFAEPPDAKGRKGKGKGK
jgi:transcriptional regulator with XRE-family HTH domain